MLKQAEKMVSFYSLGVWSSDEDTVFCNDIWYSKHCYTYAAYSGAMHLGRNFLTFREALNAITKFDSGETP